MDSKAKMRQTATMLSGSFFFLVGMLAFTLHNMMQAKGSGAPAAEALKHPLALPLIAAAIVTTVMSFVVKSMLAPRVDSTQALRERMGEQGQPSPERQGRYLAAHIVAYALSETPAIFGFVLGISVPSFEVALPFIAVSLVLFAVHWPRTDSWS